MKVFHVNTEHGWRGGERQTLFTLSGLQQRGIECALVAQPDSPIERKAKDSGIKTYPLKMNGPADIFAAFKLAGLCRSEGIDILHLQTSHAASLAALSRIFLNPAKMVAARRVDFAIKSGWKYNRFDAVVPISKAIKDILIQGGVEPARLELIPSGIPVDFDQPENISELRREIFGDSKFAIGAIGHLTDHKGQEFLIRAMPRVADQIPGAKLALIGGGELRQGLESLARDLSLEDRVVFTGFREDAPSLIHTFDLFVHPSRLEGLCTTILDVLLRQVPVIASRTGGIPEATGEGRFAVLVDPGKPEAIAEAIVNIYQQRPAEAYLKEGSEFVRADFSVDVMVDKTVKLYQKLKKRT
jgi:glycosyltransferase involved in cell wall biosynthesis